jgi:hypothetical protein
MNHDTNDYVQSIPALPRTATSVPTDRSRCPLVGKLALRVTTARRHCVLQPSPRTQSFAGDGAHSRFASLGFGGLVRREPSLNRPWLARRSTCSAAVNLNHTCLAPDVASCRFTAGRVYAPLTSLQPIIHDFSFAMPHLPRMSSGAWTSASCMRAVERGDLVRN